jgi:hypothetical protein
VSLSVRCSLSILLHFSREVAGTRLRGAPGQMARSGNYQDTCCVWICPVIVIVLRFRSLRPKTHQAAFGSNIVLVLTPSTKM